MRKLRKHMTPNQKTLDALNKVERNIKNNDYIKLSQEESDLVRTVYASRISIPEHSDFRFENEEGTLIALGFSRIVVGDYGAYLEFSSEQIQLNNIENAFLGKPNRPVKYIWMQTKDDTLTKVYWQKKRVSYADYKPGFYYVSPGDLYLNGECLYSGEDRGDT